MKTHKQKQKRNHKQTEPDLRLPNKNQIATSNHPRYSNSPWRGQMARYFIEVRNTAEMWEWFNLKNHSQTEAIAAAEERFSDPTVVRVIVWDRLTNEVVDDFGWYS